MCFTNLQTWFDLNLIAAIYLGFCMDMDIADNEVWLDFKMFYISEQEIHIQGWTKPPVAGFENFTQNIEFSWCDCISCPTPYFFKRSAQLPDLSKASCSPAHQIYFPMGNDKLDRKRVELKVRDTQNLLREALFDPECGYKLTWVFDMKEYILTHNLRRLQSCSRSSWWTWWVTSWSRLGGLPWWASMTQEGSSGCSSFLGK